MDDTDNQPPVTVVVPTHNRPEMMRRAVESVLSQTYTGHIEVIVVFDATEVALPDVAVPAHRALRGTANDRTRGLAGARNTGICAAAHEIVAFLDDDDAWLPTKLDAQLRRLADCPTAVMVGTAMVVDGGTRRHTRSVPVNPVTVSDLVRDRMAGLHSSSFVFRREALLGPVGLVDEELPASYGEDYDMLLRTAKVAPIEVVNEPLVEVTWQGQSYYYGRWATYAQALEYLLDKHPEFDTTRRGRGRIESQIAFALAASAQRAEGRRWAWKALRNDPSRVRAYLAIAISFRLMSAAFIAKTANRFGKGI